MRKSIGLTGQYAAVDEYLTGEENLLMLGRALPPEQTGHQTPHPRSLGIIRTDRRGPAHGEDLLRWNAPPPRPGYELIASPPVLFLDEPTTGLDPRSRLTLWT